MVKVFLLKAFKKKEDSGDGFQQPDGASTHPQGLDDKY